MNKCFFCGTQHEFKCPMVKAYEYRPDGTVSRIEFVTFADCLQKVPELPVASLPAHPTRQ